MGKLKVLMIMEQCNPEWPSVPLLAYHFFQEMKQRTDLTLCTHERNRTELEKRRQPQDKIVYIAESAFYKIYYKAIFPFTHFHGPIWPLVHTLTYPIYAEFNRKADRRFRQDVLEKKFDVVHAMTPIIPRYPVKIVEACKHTPFLLGPVNGGIPYPPGFNEIAKKEKAFLNFLRGFSKWIPGYMKTYRQADKVLVGSLFTETYLREELHLDPSRLERFSENGVDSEFFSVNPRNFEPSKPLQLLFVGRLVPYKGAGFLIQAISRLSREDRNRIHLKIVGDGEEKSELVKLTKEKKLEPYITFQGWVEPEKIKDVYHAADIFCFPSIREFGGAVILEAMAAGLPSIVVDYGGVGEYTTEETSIKIAPSSSEFIINELCSAIQVFLKNPSLHFSMGKAAIEQARKFEWGRKADQLVQIYEQLLLRQIRRGD